MLKEYIERKELNEWLEEERFKFEEQIDFTPDEDELNSDEYELYEKGYFRCFDNVMSIVNDVPVVELDDSRLNWISVDERLPESSGAYLIFTTIHFTPAHIDECDHYDGIEIAYYSDEFTCFHGANGIYAKAWMPLPEPPKGE